MRFLTCMVAAWVFIMPLRAPAQIPDGAPSPDKKVFAFLINGWKAEREKLTAGKVEMSGEYRRKDGKRKERSPLYALLVFDNLRNLKRGYTDWRSQSGWLLTTPDRVVSCENMPLAIVTIKNPDPNDRASDFQGYRTELDPRCWGAGDLDTFYDGGLNFERVVKFWESIIKTSTCKVDRRDGGIYEIQTTKKFQERGAALVTVVINEAKGFSFEKFEFARKGDLDNPNEGWVKSSAECEWTSINGVWVPVKYKARGELDVCTLELDLKWHNVGGPFGVDEFTLENLGIPQNTMIVDCRLGEERLIMGYTQASHDSPPVLESDAGFLRARTIGIIAANFILLAIILGAWYWRRHRKVKSAG